MLRTSIGRLRAIGLVEAVSFLVLLGVAMPLKYFAGLPEAVKIVGWLHGLLFIFFCIALAQARLEAQWNIWRTGTVLVAALLPVGPSVITPAAQRRPRSQRKRSLKKKLTKNVSTVTFPGLAPRLRPTLTVSFVKC